MNRFLSLILLILISLGSALYGQTITLSPSSPIAEQSVTITIDVSGTNLAGEAKIRLLSYGYRSKEEE